MGISAVLSSALSGLHATEQHLDVIARNIANAETSGYTRKTVNREAIIANTESSGVRIRSIGRELDALLQGELRNATSAMAATDAISRALDQLDTLIGAPGGAYSLDTLFNAFGQSLQELAATPESPSARQEVLTAAQTLAQRLNQTSDQIQRLRSEADRGLASAASEANAALQQIEVLNARIIEGSSGGVPPADLLDERDRQIDKLAELFDIDVFTRENGDLSIFTRSGISLFDGVAAVLGYDERGAMSASTLYSEDPLARTVGTITINSPLGGNEIDLLRSGMVRSGAVHGYTMLRDDLLVTAQAQLDEIAAALASTFSDREVAGSPVAVGAQSGFEIDLNDLKSGNALSVTTTVSGATRTYTFIRVDDPSQLPLSDGVTAKPDDTVVGIDFSGGFAAAAAAIDAALGADVSASDAGGGILRILDDGAAGLSDIDAAGATVTESGLQSGAMQLPFFIVAAGSPPAYTGSLDGGSQKLGFAGRIAVNPDIVADPTALVAYTSSTGLGDPARPFFLLGRLSEATTIFSPGAGIGGAKAPFTATIGDYVQKMIDYQAGQAQAAATARDAASLTYDSIATRFTATSGVNIDRELADLLVLQNAYAANARVLSAANDLMQALLTMI